MKSEGQGEARRESAPSAVGADQGLPEGGDSPRRTHERSAAGMNEERLLFVSYTDPSNASLRRSGLSGSISDLESLYIGPLRRVFAEVLVLDLGQDYAQIGVRASNQALLELAHRERPDYVLWHAKDYELLEETLDGVRRAGINVIGWFSDDEVRFENYTRLWLPHLDYAFTTDRRSMPGYSAAGVASIFLMWGSNQEVFRQQHLPPTRDVAFVGRNFADRGAAVRELSQRGVEVEAYGAGWPNGYVNTADMARIYTTSRVNLCFTKSYRSDTPPQIKGRIFDVCMAGGLLLCEYVPGLEEFFEIGREIVCFRDLDEAEAEIRRLLHCEAERAAIAAAGHERALADHKQERRFADAFRELRELASVPRERLSAGSRRADVPALCRERASRFHLKWASYLAGSDEPEYRWRDELEIALTYDDRIAPMRGLKRHLSLPPRIGRASFLAHVQAKSAWRALRRSLCSTTTYHRVRNGVRAVVGR